MKKALYFTVIYIASIIVGTLLFATMFMFSCNLTEFVTGASGQVFSLRHFLSGLLISIPLVTVIVQVLLIYYQLRHPNNGAISLLFYVIFGLINWGLILPTDLNLITRYDLDNLSARQELTSTGVFRKEETGIFYFSRINEKYNADGIFIDTSGFLGTGETVLPFFDVPVKNDSAYPYSDILIKDSMQPSQAVLYPLSVYNSILTAGQYSISLGFLSWLSFASMGLALLSVWGAQYFSSWKLANAGFVFTAVVFVCAINYLYYMNITPEFVQVFGAKLSQYTGIKDPVIILTNLSIALLFSLSGLFMGIYRSKKSQGEIEE